MRYQKDSIIYTERDMRRELTTNNISIPETILPEHVSVYGFIPYVETSQPEPTVEEQSAQLQNIIVDMTQQRLDAFARTRNYDGILSLCTYATSTIPKFTEEGQYGVLSRDLTWAKLYEILEDVQNGIRPMPTGFSDIEPELPVLQWPN